MRYSPEGRSSISCSNYYDIQAILVLCLASFVKPAVEFDSAAHQTFNVFKLVGICPCPPKRPFTAMPQSLNHTHPTLRIFEFCGKAFIRIVPHCSMIHPYLLPLPPSNDAYIFTGLVTLSRTMLKLRNGLYMYSSNSAGHTSLSLFLSVPVR